MARKGIKVPIKIRPLKQVERPLVVAKVETRIENKKKTKMQLLAERAKLERIKVDSHPEKNQESKKEEE